jgi:hypothetical protein
MLDRAKRLAGPDVYVTRWMSGVIRAQLPAILGEREAALDDLTWCETHAPRRSRKLIQGRSLETDPGSAQAFRVVESCGSGKDGEVLAAT